MLKPTIAFAVGVLWTLVIVVAIEAVEPSGGATVPVGIVDSSEQWAHELRLYLGAHPNSGRSFRDALAQPFSGLRAQEPTDIVKLTFRVVERSLAFERFLGGANFNAVEAESVAREGIAHLRYLAVYVRQFDDAQGESSTRSWLIRPLQQRWLNLIGSLAELQPEWGRGALPLVSGLKSLGLMTSSGALAIDAEDRFANGLPPHSIEKLHGWLTDSVFGRGEALIEYLRYQPVLMQADARVKAGATPRYLTWLLSDEVPESATGPTVMYILGAADPIDRLAETVRARLEATPQNIAVHGAAEDEQQVKALLRELTAVVFPIDLQTLPRGCDLTISPDGSLWVVPWAALLVRSDDLIREFPYKGEQYLVEGHSIRLVFTADALGVPISPPSNSTSVILGDVDYANAGPVHYSARVAEESGIVQRGLQLRSGERLDNFARLPGSPAELQSLAATLPAWVNGPIDFRVGPEAAEELLQFDPQNPPRVLGFSTHGFSLPAAEDEDPLTRCGLVLAGANLHQERVAAGLPDGILTGEEISRLSLNGTQLVLLSACQTGVGLDQSGDGVASLRQAFHEAGCRAVLATLWSVDDDATRQLMESLGKNLIEGGWELDHEAAFNPADALARSQRGFIENQLQRRLAWAIDELVDEFAAEFLAEEIRRLGKSDEVQPDASDMHLAKLQVRQLVFPALLQVDTQEPISRSDLEARFKAERENLSEDVPDDFLEFLDQRDDVSLRFSEKRWGLQDRIYDEFISEWRPPYEDDPAIAEEDTETRRESDTTRDGENERRAAALKWIEHDQLDGHPFFWAAFSLSGQSPPQLSSAELAELAHEAPVTTTPRLTHEKTILVGAVTTPQLLERPSHGFPSKWQSLVDDFAGQFEDLASKTNVEAFTWHDGVMYRGMSAYANGATGVAASIDPAKTDAITDIILTVPADEARRPDHPLVQALLPAVEAGALLHLVTDVSSSGTVPVDAFRPWDDAKIGVLYISGRPLPSPLYDAWRRRLPPIFEVRDLYLRDSIHAESVGLDPISRALEDPSNGPWVLILDSIEAAETLSENDERAIEQALDRGSTGHVIVLCPFSAEVDGFHRFGYRWYDIARPESWVVRHESPLVPPGPEWFGGTADRPDLWRDLPPSPLHLDIEPPPNLDREIKTADGRTAVLSRNFGNSYVTQFAIASEWLWELGPQSGATSQLWNHLFLRNSGQVVPIIRNLPDTALIGQTLPFEMEFIGDDAADVQGWIPENPMGLHGPGITATAEVTTPSGAHWRKPCSYVGGIVSCHLHGLGEVGTYEVQVHWSLPSLRFSRGSVPEGTVVHQIEVIEPLTAAATSGVGQSIAAVVDGEHASAADRGATVPSAMSLDTLSRVSGGQVSPHTQYICQFILSLEPATPAEDSPRFESAQPAHDSVLLSAGEDVTSEILTTDDLVSLAIEAARQCKEDWERPLVASAPAPIESLPDLHSVVRWSWAAGTESPELTKAMVRRDAVRLLDEIHGLPGELQRLEFGDADREVRCRVGEACWRRDQDPRHLVTIVGVFVDSINERPGCDDFWQGKPFDARCAVSATALVEILKRVGTAADTEETREMITRQRKTSANFPDQLKLLDEAAAAIFSDTAR
jgi:CHAT domain-containing protein